MPHQYDETTINGLELFKSLIKDGCEWQGDVLSRKWSELLVIPVGSDLVRIQRTLKCYQEGIEYKRDGPEENAAIWIA